ncbi:MAG: hypothetical protein ISS72_11135 [Candidatus Brocadiae bacterium]|nr:hypothetical protein [Candidatus Brocadiia bacterium]
MADDRYLAYMGKGPKKMGHWEHWSCPDAETALTGIDYYEHPRLCRQKMAELYPQLRLGIPQDDTPLPRPDERFAGESSWADEQGLRHVRWGDGQSGHWNYGVLFPTMEHVLSYSPLKNADMANKPWIEARDYSDEDKLYQEFRQRYPADCGDRAPEGSSASTSFYNTMFMWPLLVFGWENFLAACLLPEFERIMDEFAEINRRVFRVFARLPINFVICHDDIVNTRGPVCSPKWMHKYIFPHYEEFWAILKAAGKEVIFMTDGCADAFADDVMACGAMGIISEPYTDYKAIARRYDNPFLAGEGDNRVLMRNDPAEIEQMVRSMVETGRMSGGYMMCVGNHIPWNVPPDAIKRYLDLSADLAHR